MKVKLTSFADLADLLEYNRRVRNGTSPKMALQFGDNGLGSTMLSTVAGTGAAVALPEPWKSKKVKVTFGSKTAVCEVRDIAPKGVCDLNPDACALLGLKPPVKEKGDFIWIL